MTKPEVPADQVREAQGQGASSSLDRATHEPSQQAVSAVPVGIPSAEAFVMLVSDYANIVLDDFHAKYPEFVAERAAWKKRYRHLSSHDATMDMFIRVAESLAQAMSAGTAKTEGLGPKDASAVVEDHASNPSITPSKAGRE